MQLAPDLAWVAIGGMEPLDFIDRFGARIAYAHAVDVSAVGSAGHCLETGRGVINYAEVTKALRQCAFAGWVIAETYLGPSWRGARDPEQSARLHFAGLTQAFQ